MHAVLQVVMRIAVKSSREETGCRRGDRRESPGRVIGVVALAVDGGLLLDNHRTVQAAADARPSAASDLYANWSAIPGPIQGKAADASADRDRQQVPWRRRHLGVTVNIPDVQAS